MFVDKSDEIIVNEVAPRPHNSGHWTMDACNISQFEALVRVIFDIPIPHIEYYHNCKIINILGENYNVIEKSLNKKNYKLRQVMSIYTPILQVTDLKKSQTIGYSQTFKTNKKIKIATIDFGYSDGYLRSGSNRGKVFIDGIPCKILGRVSMDLITIDVSKVPMKKLYLGKPVEIIGINQSYENIAYDTETNEHEILISLGRNLSRVYF